MRACVVAKFAKARWRRLGQETLIDNTEQVSRGSACERQPSFGSMLRHQVCACWGNSEASGYIESCC